MRQRQVPGERMREQHVQERRELDEKYEKNARQLLIILKEKFGERSFNYLDAFGSLSSEERSKLKIDHSTGKALTQSSLASFLLKMSREERLQITNPNRKEGEEKLYRFIS